MAALYSELHRMAVRLFDRERSCHTLQPTALLSELYLRLEANHSQKWRSRTHFFAVAASTLRHILIDAARARAADRRGGGQGKVSLDVVEVGSPCTYEDLLVIDEALNQLAEADARAARVTELRFFAGLEESEIAEELGISEITVKRDWKFARAWLLSHLQGFKRVTRDQGPQTL